MNFTIQGAYYLLDHLDFTSRAGTFFVPGSGSTVAEAALKEPYIHAGITIVLK